MFDSEVNALEIVARVVVVYMGCSLLYEAAPAEGKPQARRRRRFFQKR